MGWRLDHHESALTAPFWQRIYGWRRWHEHDDGFVDVIYVDSTDLDNYDERMGAVDTYLADVARREATWKT
jgi:hypothetical protein